MDRGKLYKACTYNRVKQVLKSVIPLTELYEKTRSPKNCRGCGICMCISQINICKMMNRSEMIYHVTVLRLQIPERFCVPFWLTALCIYLFVCFVLLCFCNGEVLLVLLAAFKTGFQGGKKSHLEWVVVLSFSGFFSAFCPERVEPLI